MTSPAHIANMLAAQFSRTLNDTAQRQRTYLETRAELAVRDGTVMGVVEISAPGETVAEITFPVSFLERPIFTAGLELDDSAWLARGDFPIWSATVGRWHTDIVADSTLWNGATLGIAVFGATRSKLHYCFQGRSFTNPTNASLNVGGIL